ncbi:MAG: hypothetical protein ACOYL6_08905 [Bacteriovoracaceae bacterium]
MLTPPPFPTNVKNVPRDTNKPNPSADKIKNGDGSDSGVTPN